MPPQKHSAEPKNPPVQNYAKNTRCVFAYIIIFPARPVVSRILSGAAINRAQDDHLSRAGVTTGLMRTRREWASSPPYGMIRRACSRRGLPPFPSTGRLDALTPRFTLTPFAAVSFLWHFPTVTAVAVSNRPALCCPDFPHQPHGRPRSSPGLTSLYYQIILHFSTFMPRARSIARFTCGIRHLFFSRYTCS